MLTKQPQQRRLNHDTRLGDDPRAQRADKAAKRWPLTFFAVQQGGKCDRQGPDAVNPYLQVITSRAIKYPLDRRVSVAAPLAGRICYVSHV